MACMCPDLKSLAIGFDIIDTGAKEMRKSENQHHAKDSKEALPCKGGSKYKSRIKKQNAAFVPRK